MLIAVLVLCLIFGIIVILKSGDLLIESSLNISKCTGLSEQFIGATLLSFATTAPELFVSCISASKGSAEISVNNGFGSIICNIGLVLAISLVALTQKVNKKEFNFKAYILIFVFLLLFAFCLNGNISKLEGALLILTYVVFLIVTIKNIKNNAYNKNKTVKKKELIFNIIMFLLGAIGVALSANLLVNSAQKLALKLNISEAVIALTVLAIGTCLPELVSTLTAIKKKTLNLALGNIVGANIMNCTILMGISSILSQETLKISPQTQFITIPFCIIFNFILLLPILFKQKTFKIQGILMLFTFFVYYFLIFYFLN